MEYARFSIDGSPCWVRRESAAFEWENCALDDVSPEEVARQAAVAARKVRIAEHGYDPEAPSGPFAVITRGPGPDSG